MQIRRTAIAVMSAAALSVTGVVMATPASAQPVVAGGLVAVNVSDIDLDLLNDSLNRNDVRILNNLLRDSLNDNQVGVGVVAQVAAQLCNVNVGGILGQFAAGADEVTCETAYGDIVFEQVEG